MTDDQRLRQKIIAVRLYSVSRNAAAVHRQLLQDFGINAMDSTSVLRVNKQFDNTGSVTPRASPGRPLTARTDENRDMVLEQLNTNIPLSTRRMSLVTDISRTSLQRILHDLNAKPYIPRLIHQLSEDDFDRRIETCETLLQRFDEDPSLIHRILWSDESTFTLAGTVNRHNCVLWSLTNQHLKVEKDMQHRASVTVWAGISSAGIIGPVFIEGTVNAEKYLKILQEHVFNLAQDMWFMQDGAPAHFARKVREELDMHLPGRWIGRRGAIEWSPRSCDLTPCDFFLWGFLKDKVYKRNPQTLPQLQAAIQEEVRAVSPEVCRKVCGSVSRRLQTCIDNDGHQFEYLE